MSASNQQNNQPTSYKAKKVSNDKKVGSFRDPKPNERPSTGR